MRRSDRPPSKQDRRHRSSQPLIITVNGVYSDVGDTALSRVTMSRSRRHTVRRSTSTTPMALASWGAIRLRSAYGRGGGGVMRHFDLPYDNTVYIGPLEGLLLEAAFVTCRSPEERSLITKASTLVFSGRSRSHRSRRLSGSAVNAEEAGCLRGRLQRVTRRITTRSIHRVDRREHTSNSRVDDRPRFVSRVIRGCQIAGNTGFVDTGGVPRPAPRTRRIAAERDGFNSDSDRDLVARAVVPFATNWAPPNWPSQRVVRGHLRVLGKRAK